MLNRLLSWKSSGVQFEADAHHLILISELEKAVTLSSEAELCGVVKGTTEAIGIQSDGRDFGLSMTLSIHTDSAAAAGICERAGIGWVRLLAVGQQRVRGLRRGDFRLFRHVAALSLKRLVGRAVTAPRAQLQLEPAV